MKYNDNGTYKDIYVKTFDTLPVGAEVDYDGSVVPDGWTEIDNPNEYSTDEVRIGTWINGKPIYRKVIQTTMPEATSTSTPAYNYIALDNVEELISLTGIVYQTNAAGTDRYAMWRLPVINVLSSPYTSADVYYKWDFYSTAEGKNSIAIRSTINWLNNMDATIIVEYTKNSD